MLGKTKETIPKMQFQRLNRWNHVNLDLVYDRIRGPRCSDLVRKLLRVGFLESPKNLWSLHGRGPDSQNPSHLRAQRFLFCVYPQS